MSGEPQEAIDDSSERFTARNSLLTTHYSLLTAHCSLLAHRDLAACLLLVLLAFAFPWQLSLLGYLPGSIDFVLQYYPNLAFLGRGLRAGDLPLWNPHVFAGTPYLADPQSGALYLPNWPFLLLLDTAAAARAIVAAHYLLAAVGTYLYLRAVRLPPAAALVGAALFGLSDYSLTLAAGVPLLVNLAWIPVVLLLVELSLQRRSLGYALAAATALAMQLFNGWLHGVYITAFAVLATFLWHAATGAITSRDWRPAARATFLMAATGGAALALGAPLLLPALEFTAGSNYLMQRGLERAGGEGNVTILAVLGIGGSESHGAYVGALGLLLVLLGALHGRDRKRALLYLLLGSFSLLVAFGIKAPLYAYLYQWVPGFQTFHTPGRFMVLYLFSASALAAMGAEALLAGAGRRQALTVAGAALLLLAPFYQLMSRMFAPEAFGLLANNLIHWSDGPYVRPEVARHLFFSGVAALLFLLAVGSGRLSRGPACGVALLLLVGDLFLARGLGPRYFIPPPPILQEAAAAPLLEAESSEQTFRTVAYSVNGTLHFLSDFPNNLVPALAPPNLAMLYGQEDLRGYNPLQLRRYADYLAAVNGAPDDYHWALVYNLQSRLLDLLNLGYVTLRGDEARLRNVTVATALDLKNTGQSITVRIRPIRASGLQVFSYLGDADMLGDGQVAARLRVVDRAGGSWTFDLRAGVETAEWAYDRADVLARVRHRRATVSLTRNVGFPVNTYVADLAFPRPVEVAEITLERVEPGVYIAVPELAVVPLDPARRYRPVGEIQGTRLYRNELALPRALLVPGSEVIQDPAAVLDRLLAEDFDPRREVVLEGPGAPARQAGEGNVGEVVVVSRSNNRVRLDARARAYGFLLLNELSYPGWNAYLDGRRVEVWRANYLFRAIEVPPGAHQVEFRFEPDSLKLGLALSLPTLALLLAAAAWHFRRSIPDPCSVAACLRRATRRRQAATLQDRLLGGSA